MIRDSSLDFRINPDSDLDVCLNRSQNVVDLLSCRHQSFRRVSWKSTGDCMRNANKSPKIPYFATVREVKKWSGIRTRHRITTKSWTFLPTGRPNHTIKFKWNRLITFALILHTDRQNDRMTDWRTNRTYHWSQQTVAWIPKLLVNNGCNIECTTWHIVVIHELELSLVKENRISI